MDKWNIIFLGSDIFLMGVVIVLLFRMRSSAARAGNSAEKETSFSGETSEAAIDLELQRVQKAAKSLEIKRAEMDLLGRELKEKQDQLESVIGKVEAVIDTMATPAMATPAAGTSAASATGEPSRGETLAMAREMIYEGKSFDEISEKLKLYRGELELLSSLEKLSSE